MIDKQLFIFLVILFFYGVSCSEDGISTIKDVTNIEDDSEIKDISDLGDIEDSEINEDVGIADIEDVTIEDTVDIREAGGDIYDVLAEDVITDTIDIGDIEDSGVDIGIDVGCNINCGDNASCINGSCVCNQGYWNCNSGWADGCESNSECNGSHLWSKRFGGAGEDWAHSVTVDSSGNVYIIGDFRSPTINFGGDKLTNRGGNDIFLSKFDSAGSHLWSKSFVGTGDDYGNSVSVDSSGNVYIIGDFRSSTINFGGEDLKNVSSGYWEIFLAKFDSAGKHQWSKSFSGKNNDRGLFVSVDINGNVYITGYFNSSLINFGGGDLTNSGGLDIFLAKFDKNGNHQWSKSFGGTSYDVGSSVSVDNSGNVYIAGFFGSSLINFGGGDLINSGGDDFFLAKFDKDGNHLWSKSFGGIGYDECNSVSLDSSGNLFITGYFNSSLINFGGGDLTNSGWEDIFLAKFDKDGNHLWSKSFGEKNYDSGYSVSVDNNGNLYITGNFYSSNINFGGENLINANSGTVDIFLVKFDSNGNHLWSKSFGGTSNDKCWSVSVDARDNVYITGYFNSPSINFGGGELINIGGDCGDYHCNDIFLVKLKP